jgi:hypothetical protein
MNNVQNVIFTLTCHTSLEMRLFAVPDIQHKIYFQESSTKYNCDFSEF